MLVVSGKQKNKCEIYKPTENCKTLQEPEEKNTKEWKIYQNFELEENKNYIIKNQRKWEAEKNAQHSFFGTLEFKKMGV